MPLACQVAWDQVEELSAAASHMRDNENPNGSQYSDPLEKYCADNPETDECRIYEVCDVNVSRSR